jgi:hypothetical protein
MMNKTSKTYTQIYGFLMFYFFLLAFGQNLFTINANFLIFTIFVSFFFLFFFSFLFLFKNKSIKHIICNSLKTLIEKKKLQLYQFNFFFFQNFLKIPLIIFSFIKTKYYLMLYNYFLYFIIINIFIRKSQITTHA